MDVEQIYELMNTVTNEVLGKENLVTESMSNVVDIGMEAPVITGQPQNAVSAGVHKPVTLSIKAIGGNLKYTWYYNHRDSNGWRIFHIGNGKSTIQLDMDRDVYDGIKVRCVVSNELGSVTSNTAVATFAKAP